MTTSAGKEGRKLCFSRMRDELYIDLAIIVSIQITNTPLKTQPRTQHNYDQIGHSLKFSGSFLPWLPVEGARPFIVEAASKAHRPAESANHDITRQAPSWLAAGAQFSETRAYILHQP
ncbi:hypothetical protein CEXT_399201 [Caerostris extrusa]|uniref:Uncharacterized protein n=1 Tax=Caerostris extrusa TaxID=172846 RepID=A0AAV4TKZ9_CAEEX|nr:hypothetical protein CEXT_399201 [Caerostris extrusa]